MAVSGPRWTEKVSGVPRPHSRDPVGLTNTEYIKDLTNLLKSQRDRHNKVQVTGGPGPVHMSVGKPGRAKIKNL